MGHRFTRRRFIQAIAAASGGLSLGAVEAFGRQVETWDPARKPVPTLLGAAEDSLSHLDPMTVQVGEDRLVLESGTRFRMTDCQSVLYWRPSGRSDWLESRTGRLLSVARSPERVSFTAAFGSLRAEIAVTRFMGDRVWRFSGSLTNGGEQPVDLARFHYLDGMVPGGLSFLELMGPREQPRLRSGPAVLSPRADKEQFWRSAQVTWPQLAEPIHDQVGWFVSTDIAALVERWNAPGWGFGFVGPGSAFGEIGYRAVPSYTRVFVGTLLDNVRLDPGETRPLESAIAWCGDWQSGLDVWARVSAAECGARKPGLPLVGYCSWYQKQARITPRDIDAATREFASWPVPPGGRMIQVDDGFEVQPGNWDPDDRFRAAWPGLARRIDATGSLPGLWLAPTAVYESHPIVREHPDWLQCLANGVPAITFHNWGATYYLEPDHPEVRAWIRKLFQRFCAEGWKYFKIDFAYAITAARVAYNRKKTRFESLRDLFALFREGAGPDVLINACIGNPYRYALGHVDAARLGGDMSYDYAGVRSVVRQLLTRTSTNGVWWQGDPDCFTMADRRLSTEEKRLLTGTLGLFGGLLLTSDLPSQWNQDEAAFVRRFWNERGPQAPWSQYVVWDAEGQVRAYRLSYGDARSPAHRIALYNWGDAPRDNRLRLADARLDASAAWRLTPESAAAGAILANGAIEVPNQPAHSLRIAGLEPA